MMAPGSSSRMSSTITMPAFFTLLFSYTLRPPSAYFFESPIRCYSGVMNSVSRRLRRSLLTQKHTRAETTIIVIRTTKLTISVFVRLSLLYSAVSVSAAFKAVSYFYFSSACSSTSLTQLVSRLESVTPLIPVKLENPDKLTSRDSSVNFIKVSVAPSDGTPKVS